MSAYIVSKAQVDVLVTAGASVVSDEPQPVERLSSAGQALLDECVRSVAYRYSKPGRVCYYGHEYAERTEDDDLGELPGSYDSDTIPGTDQEIEIGQWLTPYEYRSPKQPVYREDVEDEIRCYEYQSCEHPEWEESWAHDYCQGLRAQLHAIPAKPKPVYRVGDPS